MIQTRTVFVLGAGASIPYGFPSGSELRDELCGPITGRKSGAWVSLLKEACGVSNSKSRQFAKEFLESSVISIDAFLSRRMDAFGEIGKLAIAAILCEKETAEIWRKTDADDDWYTALWNALIAGAHNAEDIGNNQVRFVTFNYDRSLEYFLQKACRVTFGCEDAAATNALRKLKVVHVYGALGELCSDVSDVGRPYDHDVGYRELMVAAKGLKIIPEARDDAEEFQAARDLLSWANQICFLGFGFDQLNVTRLNLASVLAERRESNNMKLPRIVASVYSKTKAESGAIRSILCPKDKLNEYDAKNLMTLRESGILL